MSIQAVAFVLDTHVPEVALRMRAWSQLRNNRRCDALWDKQGGRCWYCGEEVAHSSDWTPTKAGFVLKSSRRSRAIDHQLPRCQGGSNKPENLVLVCTPCNSRKGGKNVEQYRAWLGKGLFYGEEVVG